MPRIRIRLLRNTSIDGRPVRADSREIVTEDEADFLIARGYARAEPIKPRRSKKGKPGYVDKKQTPIEKLLHVNRGDHPAADAGRFDGELQAAQYQAAGVEETPAAAAAAAEARQAGDVGAHTQAAA